MNRIFGFFKDKLTEAKEENQKQIQNIVTALDAQPYSTQKMLAYMQEIKTNYLEWNIMIANEASTGLYFTQLHNKSSALKKTRAAKEHQARMSKNQIVIEQMEKTLKELKSIDNLNKEWANQMSRKVENLGEIISKNKRKEQDEKEKTETKNEAQQTQVEPENKEKKTKENELTVQTKQSEIVQELVSSMVEQISSETKNQLNFQEERPLQQKKSKPIETEQKTEQQAQTTRQFLPLKQSKEGQSQNN